MFNLSIPEKSFSLFGSYLLCLNNRKIITNISSRIESWSNSFTNQTLFYACNKSNSLFHPNISETTPFSCFQNDLSKTKLYTNMHMSMSRTKESLDDVFNNYKINNLKTSRIYHNEYNLNYNMTEKINRKNTYLITEMLLYTLWLTILDKNISKFLHIPSFQTHHSKLIFISTF